MYIPMRRSFGAILGVLALLGPLGSTSQAQFRFGFSAAGPGIAAFNPYINPLAGQAFGFMNGAAFASPWAALGGYGAGRYSMMMHGGGLGYGNLHGGGYGGGVGGANSLLASSALLGAGYGYGFGLGNTQWMMNPYQGYLQGAADITRANAQYYQTIQQARLSRQEQIRSSLETRRAMIEEAEWERAHMPDPEKIRQRTLERQLNRARRTPPPNDIWSAAALNTLLRHLITQQADGAKGPRIQLSEDLVNHINVKVGDSVGHIGLLKKGGELDWPESLQGSTFKEGREQLNDLMRRAYKSVASGNNPDAGTLNDLVIQYRKLRKTVNNNVDKLKPDAFIEATHYLDEVGQTIKGLEDPNVSHQFNEDWKPKARDVAGLVQHMREKGLVFAPATDGDEAAYMALYHALASFDAGMVRPVNGGREGADNK